MISWFEKHNKLSWIITILIAIFIFYISSLSFEFAPAGGYGWKTIAYHIYAFLFLTGFLLISLIKGRRENKNLFFWGLVFVILYAISDEIHQLFVLGRCCSFSDVLIDLIGILVAGFIYLLSLKLNKGLKTSYPT